MPPRTDPKAAWGVSDDPSPLTDDQVRTLRDLPRTGQAAQDRPGRPGPGHEFITVSGTQQSDLIVKAYGYAAGLASVSYCLGCRGAAGPGTWHRGIVKKLMTIIILLCQGSVPLPTLADFLKARCWMHVLRTLSVACATGLLACAAPIQDTDGPATDPFFDLNDPPTFRLTVDETDWQQALWDQVPEDLCDDRPYLPMTVSFTDPMNGVESLVQDVGVRWRGHSSMDGEEDGGRVGLKLSFNAFEKGRELHGLRKVNLMGTEGDFSAMREHLSLRIARDLGVPAPLSGYAHLYVNDEYMGLYPHTQESDDDPYLAANFDDDSGHLYKVEGYCGGRGDFAAQGSLDDYAETYLPKADTLVEDLESDLIPLIRCANNWYDAEFEACAPELIDVDAFLRLIAIDVVLPDVDGMIGAGQNFMLYGDPSIDRIVPWFWDKDLALDDNNMAESWDLAGVHPAWREDFRSVLGDRLVRTWPDAYCDHVLAVAERAAPETMLPEIEELRSALKPLLMEDPHVDLDRWSYVTDDILNVLLDHQPVVMDLAEGCQL